MNYYNEIVLRIGDLVARRPIVQGGMGVGISLSELASSVANEGGIGVIATAGIGIDEPDYRINFRAANIRALKKEIRKAREKTSGIIGVNIMLALSDYDELISTAIDEKIDIVFMSAGLPIRIPSSVTIEKLKNSSTQFVPVVSSARALKVIFRSWSRFGEVPNAVVIEGPKAGGHLGFKPDQLNSPAFSLEKILLDVKEELISYEKEFEKKVSIIAGGGVYTGADIRRFIRLGASGVQMGTRFVATKECDADVRFKQAYINCQKKDLKIINSPVGLPGRAIDNNFLRDVDKGVKKPFKCPWKCLKTCDYKSAPYCIALALYNARYGMLIDGFAFAGSNAYRINKIITVKQLFGILEDGYNREVQLEKYNHQSTVRM